MVRWVREQEIVDVRLFGDFGGPAERVLAVSVVEIAHWAGGSGDVRCGLARPNFQHTISLYDVDHATHKRAWMNCVQQDLSGETNFLQMPIGFGAGVELLELLHKARGVN